MTDKIPLDRDPTEYDGRDAVHLAIVPGIAGEDLEFGQHVGLSPNNSKEYSASALHKLGIVNPFLKGKKKIKKGQRFWLILYPNTITSLRHVWQHPSFQDEGKLPQKPSALQHIELIAKEVGVDSTALIEAAHRYVKSGDYWNMGELFDGIGFPYEFWDHYDELFNTKVVDRHSFFTCSC